MGFLLASFQTALARTLPHPDLERIVAAMSHDERADKWKRPDPEARNALMPGLAQAERDDIRRLAAYPEGTAGAMITSDYATLAPDETVRQAIAHLRAEALDAETIHTGSVAGKDQCLSGVLTLRDLILAEGTTLMQTDPGREDASEHGYSGRTDRHP